MITLFIYVVVVKSSNKLLHYLMFDLNTNGSENEKFTNLNLQYLEQSQVSLLILSTVAALAKDMIDKFNELKAKGRLCINFVSYQI